MHSPDPQPKLTRELVVEEGFVQAWNAGRKAFEDGRPRTECPYIAGGQTDLYEMWMNAWEAAFEAARKI